MASQIGSGLTGVLYVLDEPSIGLHQKDNIKLINALKRLRDLGNTVVVVEHDTETMENDHIKNCWLQVVLQVNIYLTNILYLCLKKEDWQKMEDFCKY